MITLQQILTKYGQPGDNSKLTTITLPYPMKLAWAPTQVVTKITCHKLIAQPLIKVFSELLQAYGLDEIKRLGLDLFGGCVNVRPKRGTEKRYAQLIAQGKITEAYQLLSRHAWGIAIDLDPARNGLRVKKPLAQFSKPEYKKMREIFYSNGFIGYGPEKDYDYMHWEIRE